ncbi:hypothetical protein NEMIN01_2345 [Nematocida minor]|uniref:uncharacterized protein n=1 Tax=Nematocida minor TaxID=1912983 RepID=UPI00221EDF93|nr:uncharacterized protein NEMIN01_2345 [Nematocida minor]KAI5193001.1 hypothetical protein NEMIN01_2345 [Nematocida minor]
MREVKLTINVEGILKECQSVVKNDTSIKADDRVSHMNMLKRIIKDNLRIESEELSEEKKEAILKIIENNACQYFIYILDKGIGIPIINSRLLCGVCGLKERVKLVFISSVIELINPNKFIYNPEHGINREFDMHEKLDSVDLSYGELDLSTRTYTLMVDDTNLENILQLTSKDMDRENAFFVSNYMRLMYIDLFKKYTSVKGCYSLDNLYTKEKDKVPLIDYGLKLIYEKYYLIEGLVRNIKEIESSDNNDVHDIPEKLSNLLKNEELEVIFSILNIKISNWRLIWREKMIYINMIKAIECMATSTDLLGGKDEQKVLKIKADLSNFSEDYISGYDGLLDIMFDKEEKLRGEKRILYKSIEIEKEKWDKKEKSLTEWKNTTELDPNSQEYQEMVRKEEEEMKSILHEINFLNNKIYLSNFDTEKVKLILEYINRLRVERNQLLDLSPVQKQYFLKKIKELAKLLNIQVVVTDEPEAVEKMKVNEPVEQHQTLDMSGETGSNPADASARTSTLGKVLAGGLLVLGSTVYTSHRYSKSKPKSAANSDSDSLYHVMDSRQLQNMNNHDIS